MTQRQIIYLKLAEIGIIGLYLISFLWLSLLYLFGYLYQSFMLDNLEENTVFPMLVIVSCLLGILFIMFKLKGANFWQLLLQAFGIIVFAVPMFVSILAELKIGIDDVENSIIPTVLTIILTMLTVGFNDWKKIKAANSNLNN